MYAKKKKNTTYMPSPKCGQQPIARERSNRTTTKHECTRVVASRENGEISVDSTGMKGMRWV